MCQERAQFPIGSPRERSRGLTDTVKRNGSSDRTRLRVQDVNSTTCKRIAESAALRVAQCGQLLPEFDDFAERLNTGFRWPQFPFDIFLELQVHFFFTVGES
jgi:hypothetical protein